METTPATPPPDRQWTLMTVHAHPDDETIGTGGVMAKAVADGHRVVLVTCTRGELGEIVDPELDTPENHRRLGEIRAAELETAMGALGVTGWENLGYRDSGMMGEPGNHDPRSFWQADRDETIGRLVWMVRRYRPDVITGYNNFGGYGHPDHVNAHRVAVGAFYRAGDPEWYPEQLAPEHGGPGSAVLRGQLFRVPLGVARPVERADRDAVRVHMIGVPVAAEVVVSGDYIGPVAADHPDQPPDRLIAVRLPEAPRVMVARLAHHPGVAIAQVLPLGHAERAHRRLQLRGPDLAEAPVVLGRIQLRVDDLAELAARTSDQDDAVAD